MPPAHRNRFIRVLAIGLLLVPTLAAARDADKTWEFGPYAMISRYSNSTGFDSTLGFGVRGAYHLKAIHEFEVDLDMATADQKPSSSIQFDVTKFGAGYVRNFLIKGHEKMTPFATFGLGWVTVDDGSDSEGSTVYRVGGGFKYWFTSHVGFRWDARVWRWHGNGDVVSRDPYFSADIVFGLSFLTGGTK